MKKIWLLKIILFSMGLMPIKQVNAQTGIIEVIQAGIKKAIKAVDLKIQRLQNQTVWLQNAQKVLENHMSKLKLAEISNWANKQKDLYGNYFDELWKVKSAISSFKAVKDIINKQILLVKEYSTAFNLSKQDKNFTAEELKYMKEVYTGILDESLKNISQVQMVLNVFSTQMTDAKRLEIIHFADDNMDQNIADLRQFNQQNILISMQRSKEKNEVDLVKKLYGLK